MADTKEKTKKPAARKPQGKFRVLIGCNAANGDRFEVDGEVWPVSAMKKTCRGALIEMGAIELIEAKAEE